MKDKLHARTDYSAGEVRQLEEYIKVRPYTLKEICSMYGMSYKTMRSLLLPIAQKIGPKSGRLFTVHQVEIIFEHIGLPYILKEI